MSLYRIVRTQKIPSPVNEVWDFISSPANLKLITPAYMDFDVRTPNLPVNIYPGMRIAYTIRPVLGFKLYWETEIMQVKICEFFIDEQRKGPYKLWQHKHTLRSINGGTLMTDIVNYQPPLGFIGNIANSLFVENQLAGIFDFRYKAIEQIFGKFTEHK